jgi:hypothetical protein
MQQGIYFRLANRQHYGLNKGTNYTPATASDSGTIPESSLELTIA